MNDKTVAIVGFGDSLVNLAQYIDQVDEIWSLNDAEDYDLPWINRLFDVHPLERLTTYSRWNRLTKELPYPVYLMDKHPAVPSSVRYPIEWVLDEVFKHIYVEENRAKYLTSTFPFMVALAVLEGEFKTIRTFGFEFRSDTEWRYQRDGATLIIGWAGGRGVEVKMSNPSLLPPTLYAYEDYQMMSTDMINNLISKISKMQVDFARDQHLKQKKLLEARKNGNEKRAGEFLDQASDALKKNIMAQGAINVLKHEIGEGELISRQNLEGFYEDTRKQYSLFLGNLNRTSNLMIERKTILAKMGELGIPIEEFEKQFEQVKNERNESFDDVYMAAGSFQIIQHQIDILDRKHIPLEFVDTVIVEIQEKENADPQS